MASVRKYRDRYRVEWSVKCVFGPNRGKFFRGSMVLPTKGQASSFARTVDEKAADWKAGRETSLQPKVAPLFETLVKDFFAAKSELTDRTRDHYQGVFDKFTVAHGQTVDRIDTPTIRRFVDSQNCPSTCNNHLTALKSLFRYAKEYGHLAVNPAKEIANKKVGDVQKTPPTRKQMAAVLKAAHGLWKYRIAFLAHTGLRISEALSLTPADVREDRLIVLGKGNKRRSVPLDLIAKLAWRRLDGRFYDHGEAKEPRRACANELAKTGTRAKVEDLGPHLCRHWFATQLAESGVDVGRLARILGHSTPTITWKVYVHYLDERPVKAGHRRHWRRTFGS